MTSLIIVNTSNGLVTVATSESQLALWRSTGFAFLT